jgi:hypothetical protein
MEGFANEFGRFGASAQKPALTSRVFHWPARAGDWGRNPMGDDSCSCLYHAIDVDNVRTGSEKVLTPRAVSKID